VDNHEATQTRNIELNEEQIVDYLKNHPDFFLKREDLLTEMQLAQDKGNAVSLVERQVSVLRDRNTEMRSRLSHLMEHAGKNDELLDKTQALVLTLLETQSLDKLVTTLQDELVAEYDIDYAKLTLFGNKPGIASRMVTADEAYQTIPGLLKNNKATCGVVRDEEAEFLFDKQSPELGSAAVIPLNYGQALGVLAIGSRDEHYFQSDMGTLFLSYIANIMSRLLLPHLADAK
jgi:uncharacterized protein YigA (DUF484 family)